MGRHLPPTTGKLEQEERQWSAFFDALTHHDQRINQRFWEYVYGQRAAITNVNVTNVTEPVLNLGVIKPGFEELTLRRRVAEAFEVHRNHWSGFHGALRPVEQEAHHALLRYAQQRTVAIQRHGTPDTREPILYSMMLGLQSNQLRLEQLVEDRM